MNWISLIFQLVPVFAYGFHVVKADLDLGSRTKAAQDALSVAIAGAAATVPSVDQALVSTIGGAAQSTLAATLSLLHAGQAAPLPTAGGVSL